MHNYNVLIRFKSGLDLFSPSEQNPAAGSLSLLVVSGLFSRVLHFSSSILCCHMKSGSCVLGTESTHWLIVPPQFGEVLKAVAVVFK